MPKYDINTATKLEIESLPGIGPVLAERIIAYRDKSGKILDLNELTNVKGIGEKKLRQFQKFLYIKK